MSKNRMSKPPFSDIWNCALSCLASSAYFITARYMETLSIDPFSVSSVFLLLAFLLGRTFDSVVTVHPEDALKNALKADSVRERFERTQGGALLRGLRARTRFFRSASIIAIALNFVCFLGLATMLDFAKVGSEYCSILRAVECITIWCGAMWMLQSHRLRRAVHIIESESRLGTNTETA